MSFFAVCLPKEKRTPPSPGSSPGRIAFITYEPPERELLQALFAEAIIPFAENSIIRRSPGIFGIVMFTLFGNLFFKSPFIKNGAEVDNLLKK